MSTFVVIVKHVFLGYQINTGLQPTYPHSYTLSTAFNYWLLTFMLVHVWKKEKIKKDGKND